MWANVRVLWQDRQVHGLELLFDTGLLALRCLSISYWLRSFLPGPDDARHVRRDNAIDFYCVLQLVVLLGLLWAGLGPVADSIIASYILFEIYLNLFNVVFIGKLRTINAPPASIERSILLLFVNVLEVTLAFGIVYRDWFNLSALEGFFKAVLVLGTIGYPEAATGRYTLLVVLQVFLGLVLVVLLLSSFVGQVSLFRPAANSRSASSSNEPLQPTGSASS